MRANPYSLRTVGEVEDLATILPAAWHTEVPPRRRNNLPKATLSESFHANAKAVTTSGAPTTKASETRRAAIVVELDDSVTEPLIISPDLHMAPHLLPASKLIGTDSGFGKLLHHVRKSEDRTRVSKGRSPPVAMEVTRPGGGGAPSPLRSVAPAPRGGHATSKSWGSRYRSRQRSWITGLARQAKSRSRGRAADRQQLMVGLTGLSATQAPSDVLPFSLAYPLDSTPSRPSRSPITCSTPPPPALVPGLSKSVVVRPTTPPGSPPTSGSPPSLSMSVPVRGQPVALAPVPVPPPGGSPVPTNSHTGGRRPMLQSLKIRDPSQTRAMSARDRKKQLLDIRVPYVDLADVKVSNHLTNLAFALRAFDPAVENGGVFSDLELEKQLGLGSVNVGAANPLYSLHSTPRFVPPPSPGSPTVYLPYTDRHPASSPPAALPTVFNPPTAATRHPSRRPTQPASTVLTGPSSRSVADRSAAQVKAKSIAARFARFRRESVPNVLSPSKPAINFRSAAMLARNAARVKAPPRAERSLSPEDAPPPPKLLAKLKLDPADVAASKLSSGDAFQLANLVKVDELTHCLNAMEKTRDLSYVHKTRALSNMTQPLATRAAALLPTEELRMMRLEAEAMRILERQQKAKRSSWYKTLLRRMFGERMASVSSDEQRVLSAIEDVLRQQSDFLAPDLERLVCALPQLVERDSGSVQRVLAFLRRLLDVPLARWADWHKAAGLPQPAECLFHARFKKKQAMARRRSLRWKKQDVAF